MNPRVIAKIETEAPTQKLAVLIDADNAQPSIIEGLLAEVAKFGEAAVKRIYGDFTSPMSASWKKVLNRLAIKPMQQFAYTTGKNATDSALIIDAMDLLYTRRFDGFCLVTSDSDFTGLALRLREEGLLVLGFGAAKTPESFRNACHRFLFTEVLRPVATHDEEAPTNLKQNPAITATAPSSTTVSSKAASNVAGAALPDTFIRDALASAPSDDAGWVHLGPFGAYLNKLRPDFDSRNYGYKKLSDLLRALPHACEVDERVGQDPKTRVIFVRSRTRISPASPPN